jgi:hypothetical protein
MLDEGAGTRSALAVAELTRGHVEAHGRRVERAGGAEVGAEKLRGIGNGERAARAGALVQHGRRQAGQAELAGRVVGAPCVDDQAHLHERHFVRLHDPHGQAVRQRALLNVGQLQTRGWAQSRRLRTVRALLCGQRRRQGEDDKGKVSRGHFFVSGSTTSSTRLSAGSHSKAAP